MHFWVVETKRQDFWPTKQVFHTLGGTEHVWQSSLYSHKVWQKGRVGCKSCGICSSCAARDLTDATSCFQADGDDWTSTPLVCCSAGWGAGGYLHVDESDCSISLTGADLSDRKRAALWMIKDFEITKSGP